ncbi:MAG: hypothetical protein LBB45_09385 [Methanobrevibacter sp.]|jgi:hypothetical protein|nr:hypothetical protein [Candidatus Methanovirga basalitermitum]
MKSSLIIGIVCMLSISLISASYLMNDDYNNDVNSLNTSDEKIVNEVPATEENVNVTDVISASKQFKQYEDENGQLPDKIEIAGKNYTVEQFLYLLSKVIVNKNSCNNSTSIPVLKYIGPAYSKGNNSAGELNIKEYTNASALIIEFIDVKSYAPNFLMNEKLGNISFNATVDGFVRIVNSMSDNNNNLIESVSFDATSAVESYTTTSSSSDISTYDDKSGSSSSSLSSSSGSKSSNSMNVNPTSNSYSGNGWSYVNSIKSQLSGMTYGSDGDCYTFSQFVYDDLSAAGYKCGIYQGHSELGNHRVPYVYVDGTFYWLETCRVVQNGWGSGTDWTTPYDTWNPEYIYLSN